MEVEPDPDENGTTPSGSRLRILLLLLLLHPAESGLLEEESPLVYSEDRDASLYPTGKDCTSVCAYV